jgi:hypothetical protein
MNLLHAKSESSVPEIHVRTRRPDRGFGDGREKAVRYFADKLPIGMQPHADSHVFVNLVTRRRR